MSEQLHVALFAYVSLKANPYIALMCKALQEADPAITIDLESEFTLRWLLSHWRGVDIVHLHWIENVYIPRRWSSAWAGKKSGLRAYLDQWICRLVNNLFVRRGRALMKLASFTGGLIAARLIGIKVIYTVHNLTAHRAQPFFFRMLNWATNRVIFALAHAVHVHSEGVRATIARQYGRTRGIFMIPHGNYVSSYPNQCSKEEAREKLNLPQDDFVYLFLGTIRPYKGVEELVTAFSDMAAQNCTLVIAGKSFSRRYSQQIEERGKDKPRIVLDMRFIPNEEIQYYMNACDICVLPYRQLTTSGAALLAFSFGRPLIAPARGMFPELITDGRGILYDPDQTGALGTALREARQQDWVAAEADILSWVRTFDWSIVAQQILDMYHISVGSADGQRRG